MYYVDVPDRHGAWDWVHTFTTKEEAIEFCKGRFGADDEGRINLITEVEDGEDEE